MKAPRPLSNAEIKSQLAKVNAKLAELRAERRTLIKEIAVVERGLRKDLLARMLAATT